MAVLDDYRKSDVVFLLQQTQKGWNRIATSKDSDCKRTRIRVLKWGATTRSTRMLNAQGLRILENVVVTPQTMTTVVSAHNRLNTRYLDSTS